MSHHSRTRGHERARRAPARRWLGFTPRRHAAALVIFGALTFAFFLPILRVETFSEVGKYQLARFPWEGQTSGDSPFTVRHGDQVESFYPWQVYTSRALRQGELPLWNPYSFGGAPFFANGQSGVLYPPRLALTYTVSPTRVHDLLLASHFFLAGVAMFLLLGFAGLSFPAALVGGLAWMLNSFAVSWQALEHYTAVEVWMPVGVMLAHATVRRRSWSAAFGLALVLSLLVFGGNVLFVELAVAAILGYAMVLAIVAAARERGSIAGNAARLATAVGLTAGLTAVTILPTLRLATESARASLSYGELGRYALPPGALWSIFRLPELPQGDPYHLNLFAGTAVGLLAVVGLLARQALARFAAVLGGLALLFMLRTPVTFVVDHALPGMSSFKPLARAAFLLQFALAVLAAYGLQALLRQLEDPRRRRLVCTPVAAGVLIGVTADRIIVHLSYGFSLNSGTGFVLALAVAPLAALAFELARRHRSTLGPRWSNLWSRFPAHMPAAAVLLVVIVAASIVGQAWIFARAVMPHQPNGVQVLYPPTPLIRQLERRREERFLPTDWTFHGSTAMVFPLLSAGGYESLLPRRTQDLWRVLGDGLAPDSLASHPLINGYNPAYRLSRLRPALLARAGIATVVSPPSDITGPRVPEGLEVRYSGRDGRIFGVAHALPRAYVVGACVEEATPFAALERFVSPRFSAEGAVILERPSLGRAGMSCSGGRPGRAGTATVRDSSLNSLVVSVQARRPGWLVVSDSWDPGWTASLDGRAVDVLPADYALRAVRIPAGAHEVRLTYLPPSFRLGVVVSAVSLAITLTGLVWTLLLPRRRRRRDRETAGTVPSSEAGTT